MPLTEVMRLISFYRLNRAFIEAPKIDHLFKESTMSTVVIYQYLRLMVNK